MRHPLKPVSTITLKSEKIIYSQGCKYIETYVGEYENNKAGEENMCLLFKN
jgi:hypothetical protein